MVVTSYENRQSQIVAAIADIMDGLSRWRLWMALAREEIQLRYKRSYIGILWTTLSFALFFLVKVVIFTPIMDVGSKYFVPYVAIGYFIWMYINGLVSDSSTVFASSENWIKGARLPLSLYVNISMARSFILMLYNALVVAAVLVVMSVIPSFAALWSILAFALCILSGFFTHFLLGIICARHRDAIHLVQAVMRVMFFLTPVFWLPEQIGPLWDYLIFNPFAHFVIAFREPLLSGAVPYASFVAIASITTVLGIVALSLFVLARRRIVFWL